MPRLVVLESHIGPQKAVDVPDAADIVDVADEYWLPIAFSCRSASCATCHVEVVEGAELLEPPGEEEQDLLDMLGGPTNGRLACQARLKAQPGTVKLRPL